MKIQSILEALPQEERDFIGTIDYEKDIVELGYEEACAAILTRGKHTKTGKQAYWLTIATHPSYRGRHIASNLLKDVVLPYVESHNGVLYSKVRPENKASQQWHERNRATRITTNVDGWDIWTIPSL